MSQKILVGVPGVIAVAREKPMDLVNAIVSGEADALLSGHGLRFLMVQWGLVELELAFYLDNPIDLVFSVRRDWPVLVSAIDKALAAIGEAQRLAVRRRYIPDFGYRQQAHPGPVLSAAEIDYLEHKQRRLGYCFHPVWRPLDYLDDGQHKGVIAEYLALFADRLGVQLDPVPSATWTEALELARDRRCDFIAGAVQRSERETFLRFTAPYVQLAHVLVARSEEPFVSEIEQLSDKVIGVPRSSAIAATLRDRHAGMRFVDYQGEDQLKAQLDSGGADALVMVLEHAAGIIERVLTRLNHQLIEAKKQADAANRAKSEFLANMSHEIRSPMNAVMGFASLLEKADQPPRNRDAIAAIQTASATLLRLIDDILDLSKVESGKLEPRFGPMELRALTAELQTMFAARVDEKGLVLDVMVDPEVPNWIETDGVRLRQILVNLIGNAVKYTEHGRIQVQMLEAYLGPLGFDLIQAEDGAEALDLTRSRRPDLILMDIGMPILDGLEATRALKFDPSTARIPVIAVTAAVIGARVEAVQRVCDGHLSKPVTKGDLIRELAIHLDHEEVVPRRSQQTWEPEPESEPESGRSSASPATELCVTDHLREMIAGISLPYCAVDEIEGIAKAILAAGQTADDVRLTDLAEKLMAAVGQFDTDTAVRLLREADLC